MRPTSEVNFRRTEWRTTLKRQVEEYEQQLKVDLGAKRDVLIARTPGAMQFIYENGVNKCP